MRCLCWRFVRAKLSVGKGGLGVTAAGGRKGEGASRRRVKLVLVGALTSPLPVMLHHPSLTPSPPAPSLPPPPAPTIHFPPLRPRLPMHLHVYSSPSPIDFNRLAFPSYAISLRAHASVSSRRFPMSSSSLSHSGPALPAMLPSGLQQEVTRGLR